MTTSLNTSQGSTKTDSHPNLALLPRAEQAKDRNFLHLVEPEGQLKVLNSPFRGSFPGVLSEALRSAGLGSRVLIAQLLKGGVEQGPKGLIRLCDRLEWFRPAIPYSINSHLSAKNSLKDKEINLQAVLEIWEICKKRLLGGKLDQLVLDEIGLAIELGYLEEVELISILEQRPRAVDVILTGPSIPTTVMAMADQVTVLRCGL